jgi:sugar phosphate isomerase/epimerase
LGDVDLQKLMSSLRKINYSGFLTSNPFSHFDRPLEALRESKAKMDSLLQVD